MLANLMEGVKTERIDDEEIHCLSKEQHISLHQTAKKWQKEWSAAFSVLVSLYTGMRKGEILGLRWCDVSLDPVRPYIHIKHTLSRHKNIVIKRLSGNYAQLKQNVQKELFLLLQSFTEILLNTKNHK